MRKTEFQEENFSEDLEQTFLSVYFLFFGGKVVLCTTFVVIFFLAGKQCYVLAYSVFSSIYTCTWILLCIRIFSIVLIKYSDLDWLRAATNGVVLFLKILQMLLPFLAVSVHT